MKKAEIKVGGMYNARVAGRFTTVRVDAIRPVKKFAGTGYSGAGVYNDATVYDVTNLTTGRKTIFKSAGKFRKEATLPPTRKDIEQTTRQATSCPKCGKLYGEVGQPCMQCGGQAGTPFKAEAEQRSDPTSKNTTVVQPSVSVLSAMCVEECTQMDSVAQIVKKSDSTVEGENSPPFDHGTQTIPMKSPTMDGTVTTAEVPSFPSATNSIAPAAEQSTPSNAGFAAALGAQTITTGRQLTDEQKLVVEQAPRNQITVIEAGAGCGKTSTLVELSNAMAGIGQYTAFNTSLVNESREKFPQRVRANTIHSLAFGSEGHKHAHRLRSNRVRASEVAAMLGLHDMTIEGPDGKPKVLNAGLLASQVTRGIKNFCQSASTEVMPGHMPMLVGINKEGSKEASNAMKEYLLPYAQKLWSGKCDPNGNVPFTHDDYVKIWSLNDPYIAADYVLLDEAQDTSPVMLSIMEAQVRRGTKVILVGDSAQQIYSWRGAINALASFPDAPRLMLSQSFRFGQVIAEVANSILRELSERTKLVMRGFDKITSKLAAINAPDCVLCRTNAGAVATMLDAIIKGKKPHLIGGGEDVISFVRAARDLKRGKTTQHPELCCFTSWSEVVEFSKMDEGEDIRLMVKIIEKFGVDRILSMLENMPSERESNLVVSTAHKSKGREWKKVRLAGDFPPLEKMDDEGVRLLYVAATRAQHVLDVEGCQPFIKTSRHITDEGFTIGSDSRTVDLTVARRLSSMVEKAEPVQEAVAALPAPVAPTPKVNGTENTWTKGRNGGPAWVVRGKPGQSGTITVTKKSGATSQETIKRQIWANTEVALYEVVS